MGPLPLLTLLLLCIFAQGFFSMFEMAAVSFNKVRLAYYASQKQRRALWLQHLIARPSRLFGTTLILVNTLLQCGSEISRLLYTALGWNPDFAPFTQVLLVLIFAELTPMFAARRHPEHVAFLYIPVVMLFSKLLTPIILLIDRANRYLNQIFGKQQDLSLFLSREELQRAFEESHKSAFDEIIGKFFTMKHLQAEKVLYALSSFAAISSQSKVYEARKALRGQYRPFILIYHQDLSNIVGIAYVRDLLKARDEEKVIDHAKSPWFIVKTDFVLEILAQFRRNSQSVAVVLGTSGRPVGLVTLDALIDKIFGKRAPLFGKAGRKKNTYFEQTVSGEISMRSFNRLFHLHLPESERDSLSDYIIQILGYYPSKGEVLELDSLLIEVVEASVFRVKYVRVKTLHL
ncbi:MAG: CNNM domain-containing protein [Chlamydiota bacterium]